MACHGITVIPTPLALLRRGMMPPGSLVTLAVLMQTIECAGTPALVSVGAGDVAQTEALMVAGTGLCG